MKPTLDRTEIAASTKGRTAAPPDLYAATKELAFPHCLCYNCPQFRAPGSALATANDSVPSPDYAAAFSNSNLEAKP
ncbi:hypothetical protein SBA4_6780002 [Candidatus Sulfopaludibacter sp. SbA4]|nr:hypothetical protein SBA4_6780002 [Candidatus Sulfopaludibacter sp. SbA4]